MSSPELSFDDNLLIDRYQPNFAMAYGSGVVRQVGYKDGEKPMIDIVMSVADTEQWHEANLTNNPKDYSTFARVLGKRFVNWLQGIGAKIYYNPFVPLGDQTMKYGVIGQDDLVRDLTEWETLYVAGRMHKPVHIIKDTGDQIHRAMQTNFQHALNVALLLLPEKFTEEELFMTIAGLSYTGDSRMALAENPDKVANIVGKNRDGFSKLYTPYIEGHSGLAVLNGGKMEQDKDPRIIEAEWHQLPPALGRRVITPDKFEDQSVVQGNLRSGIASTVNGPSKAQTIKGFLTAGPAKSVRYATRKVSKRFGG